MPAGLTGTLAAAHRSGKWEAEHWTHQQTALFRKECWSVAAAFGPRVVAFGLNPYAGAAAVDPNWSAGAAVASALAAAALALSSRAGVGAEVATPVGGAVPDGPLVA